MKSVNELENDALNIQIRDLDYRLNEMELNDKLHKLCIDFYRLDNERQEFFIEQVLYNQKLKLISN